MALKDLLTLSSQYKKIGLSEERVNAAIPVGRLYVAYWREYTDMFVDFMAVGMNYGEEIPQTDEAKDEDAKRFHFFFYQRIFLRAAMRYKYTYMTFPRA